MSEMKYIRTKNDLVLKVSDKITDEYGTYYLYGDTKWFDFQIDKVADTIGELCDLVIVFEGEKLLTIIDLENVHWKHIKETANRYKIYGSIITDKGLIYVAKMNEKGELELL